MTLGDLPAVLVGERERAAELGPLQRRPIAAAARTGREQQRQEQRDQGEPASFIHGGASLALLRGWDQDEIWG
jgi:hypothetical protein